MVSRMLAKSVSSLECPWLPTSRYRQPLVENVPTQTRRMLKEDHGFYTCETPLMGREEHDRVQEGMPVSFVQEVEEHPESLKSWSRKIASEPWEEADERHSLAQSSSREERTRIFLSGAALRRHAVLPARQPPRLHRTHAVFGNEAP